MGKLPLSFYKLPTIPLAQSLLGQIFVHHKQGFLPFKGRIVEVEAYREKDRASHSRNGITLRNYSMFKDPGTLYVYQIYGKHLCINVVSAPKGKGEAILIRAVEPLRPTRTMKRYRNFPENPIHLTNGPGKLAQAFGIERKHDGLHLCESKEFWIERGRLRGDETIQKSERIGVTQDQQRLWRFYLKGNPWVSRTEITPRN